MQGKSLCRGMPRRQLLLRRQHLPTASASHSWNASPLNPCKAAHEHSQALVLSSCYFWGMCYLSWSATESSLQECLYAMRTVVAFGGEHRELKCPSLQVPNEVKLGAGYRTATPYVPTDLGGAPQSLQAFGAPTSKRLFRDWSGLGGGLVGTALLSKDEEVFGGLGPHSAWGHQERLQGRWLTSALSERLGSRLLSNQAHCSQVGMGMGYTMMIVFLGYALAFWPPVKERLYPGVSTSPTVSPDTCFVRHAAASGIHFGIDML